MKDGIICINKPMGMTSNDVIYKMRKLLKIKKLGHTGTLDPLATGVLPVCINKGTRSAEYMDVDFKTYRCSMILGAVTDTQDITGAVLASCFDNAEMKAALEQVTEDKIREAFTPFSGLIEQYPPMYSAVKVNGRKLYDYARSGEDVELKSRQVFIKDIEIESIEYDREFTLSEKETEEGRVLMLSEAGTAAEAPENPVESTEAVSEATNSSDTSSALQTFTTWRIVYTVVCSKGTYIRTICQDVGESLGTGATMESLDRIASGYFTIENSYTLDELYEVARKAGIIDENGYSIDKKFQEEIPEVYEKYLTSCDAPLIHFGVVVLSREMARKYVDGWHIGYRECRIIKKPSYKAPVDISVLRDANPDSESNHQGSYPGLKVHPEYAGGYRMYCADENDPEKPGLFLGTAFHNDTYHKLVADKVFYRHETGYLG